MPWLWDALRRRPDAGQERLRAADDQLRVADAIFSNAQPVMVTDARARIQRVNPAFCALMGYQPEEMLEQTPRMFRSNHHGQDFYDAMVATIKQTGHWEGEVWDRRKSGDVFPKWMSITAVPNAAGEVIHMVACYTDLSGQQHAQQQIHQLAFYDVLTGLPNRALLRERLQRAQQECARRQRLGALLLLDLDDFKVLNDAQGHPVGDALLRLAGERLQQCLPADATVARLGGDEFALVLPEAGPDAAHAAAQAEALGERVLQALAQGFALPAGDYAARASVGLVLFAAEQPAADVLLQQVEMAMYQAKSDGGARLHFFDSALERAITERLQLERELRAGIAAGELVLHYQPQVLVQGGRAQVTGAEALVRWQHPARGLLGPGGFIPQAEETGLILALGHWVLCAACAQLAAWRADPALAPLTLAVNVSAAQFVQPGFADGVLAEIARSGAPAGRLKLELTESMLVDRPDAVIATMQQLRAHGLQFSLDDFGTGYSSLAYLKRLPLTQLKIDQGFVRDLESDGSDAAIARSVAALAHSLGLAVIAEGVETPAQRDLLAAMDCHAYQGYLFSRPLPLAGFEAYVRRGVSPV